MAAYDQLIRYISLASSNCLLHRPYIVRLTILSLLLVPEYSGPKWTIVRSESTAIKCLIGACHYLSILNNVKPASHHKVALGLTLLRMLSKVDKPINAGIHVRNVGTQFSGITVL